jgi:hypothetical protein
MDCLKKKKKKKHFWMLLKKKKKKKSLLNSLKSMIRSELEYDVQSWLNVAEALLLCDVMDW